jgi:L-asparaginase II
VSYQGGALLAELVRSEFVEGRHHGSVVVLGADGQVVASAGDVTSPIFPRSSNKPMQTVGMLHSGLRLTDPADLALVSASHWGQDFHIARVRSMLHSVELTEAHLRCPPALPLDEAAAAALFRSGGGPARVLMNCSGKHAGMLLTCRAAGWPVEDYYEPDHPLQEQLRQVVAATAGEPVAATGVDGCGAPLYAISLTGVARAFLTLVEAEPGSAERTVADAMRGYPELVAGTSPDATDARLMAGVPDLLVKNGAEGVAAAALPGVGAVAVKIDDGAGRARIPVLVSGLRRLGVVAPVLDELATTPVLGGGQRVGEVRSLW